MNRSTSLSAGRSDVRRLFAGRDGVGVDLGRSTNETDRCHGVQRAHARDQGLAPVARHQKATQQLRSSRSIAAPRAIQRKRIEGSASSPLVVPAQQWRMTWRAGQRRCHP